jgi:DNA adenine methylase
VAPRAALLSDSNFELVETLQRVQISADSVATCFNRLPRGRAAYYRVRKQDPRKLTPDERAARFIYLNALCFNGLYRVNREGQFNVPLGTKPRHVLFDASAFRAASYGFVQPRSSILTSNR